MKKFLKYTGLAAVSILAAACSDLLDGGSKSEVEKKDYMFSAAEAETVLLGVYRNTVNSGTYAYHLSILFNIGTDIEQVEGSTTENYRVIPTNYFTASQAEVQETWLELYNGIYNANDFLETVWQRIHNYSDEDKELALIYIAEARALRGMFYFELVRRYGNVVLMTNTAMSKQHPSTFVQADPADVYKYIEEDLLYAAENLPYAGDDNIRSGNDFRFSRGGALGLLVKVYATWAGYPVLDQTKWEQAAKTAKILVESGKHGLLADYEQLWVNTCNGVWDPRESLIEISFYHPTSANNTDPIGRIGKWNGVKATPVAGVRGSNAGNVKAVHTFVLEWRQHEGDIRRDLSVANYRYNDDYQYWVTTASSTVEQDIANDADPTKSQKNKQNYTPAKWDTEKYVLDGNKLLNNDKSNINWYFLRYADVLLLYAEALNEWKGGPTEDAYTAVNMVRRRGYGADVASANSAADLSGMGQDEFREAIRKERGYELCFEGHRRQDLIRWGIYYETVQETYNALVKWWNGTGTPNYVVKQYTIKGKHELFPIPQRDIDLMTQCKQNPGW